VHAAKDGSPQQAEDALASLCQDYWYPVYAFLRRTGRDSHEAEDLTQGFFAHVLSNDFLKSVDREKGRFRTFLLASLENFVSNAWKKERTEKRGGRHSIISWDELNGADSTDLGPFQDSPPAMLFDRTWAVSVIRRVLDKLGTEYSRLGKSAHFDVLSTFLPGATAKETHEAAAAKLGVNRAAFDLALHRFRKRFGKLLREVVIRTVSSEEEVDAEIRHLVAAWAAAIS
jgi:RNA polymerase sigma-70 factor (ECF subfamily)